MSPFSRIQLVRIHTEVSPQEEEKMDTAQEDDGVGLSFKEEREMDVSAEVFRIFASISEIDVPELRDGL